MATNTEPTDSVKPIKAYKNIEFLESREARTIRIVCEFEETVKRLREHNVKETIMFFGSARACTTQKYGEEMQSAKAALEAATTDQERAKVEERIQRLKGIEWMCGLVDKTVELSRRLTEWAMQYESTAVVGGGFLARNSNTRATTASSTTPTKKGKRKSVDQSSDDDHDINVDDNDNNSDANTFSAPLKKKKFVQTLMVCTGGGPGLMEAANMGAAEVPGAKNIGMKITLPFEQKHNKYVSNGLCFQYHYFFTRKYWMLFPCRALIVTPGGFGTMDEMFELLTLKQSGKIGIDVPIVLIGVDFWRTVLNLEAAVKYGTVSKREIESLFYTDDVEEAFAHVTKRIMELSDNDLSKTAAEKMARTKQRANTNVIGPTLE